MFRIMTRVRLQLVGWLSLFCSSFMYLATVDMTGLVQVLKCGSIGCRQGFG